MVSKDKLLEKIRKQYMLLCCDVQKVIEKEPLDANTDVNTCCRYFQDKTDKLLPKANKDSDEYKQFIMMKVYALNLEAEHLLEIRLASTRVLDVLDTAINLSEEYGLTPMGIYGYFFALAQRVAYFYMINDGDSVAKFVPQIDKVYEQYRSMNNKAEVWDGKMIFGISDDLATDKFYKKYQEAHNLENLCMDYLTTMGSKFDTPDTNGLKSTKIYKEMMKLFQENTLDDKCDALNVMAEELDMLFSRCKFKQASHFIAIAMNELMKLRRTQKPTKMLNFAHGRLALIYANYGITLVHHGTMAYLGTPFKILKGNDNDVTALERFMKDDMVKVYLNQFPFEPPTKVSDLRLVAAKVASWNDTAIQMLKYIPSADREQAMNEMPERISNLSRQLAMLEKVPRRKK